MDAIFAPPRRLCLIVCRWLWQYFSLYKRTYFQREGRVGAKISLLPTFISNPLKTPFARIDNDFGGGSEPHFDTDVVRQIRPRCVQVILQ